MEPAVGRIGRYEIERELARGGMACVYVAWDGDTRRVAVKRALPELAREPEFAEMFRGEARLAASLAHHNIVAVHDLGDDYMVMELLHGADVGSLLRAAPGELPLTVALAIATDACAGLHHAHERRGEDGRALGIIHRDVSPQNLFVTFDGCTKVLDFGIAKAIDRIGDRATRTGTLRGKVPYMSPEQCRGEVLDRRTDVFSLGIVLWELVRGERLYGARGESDFEVFKQIAERDAPELTTVPPELAKVIGKALARDREARYPTVAALHDALEPFPRASARRVGAFVVGCFADRADAWRRGTIAGAAVRSGRATAPGTREVADVRATASAPIIEVVAAAATQPTRANASAPVPAAAPPKQARGWIVLMMIGAIAIVALGAGYVLGNRHEATAIAAPGKPIDAAPPAAKVIEGPDFFQSDDFIISDSAYANDRLLYYLTVAKRLPDGHYLDAHGADHTPPNAWQTRAAQTADLALGVLAFCHVGANALLGSVPATRDDARLGQWAVSRITDVGELPASVRVGDIACPIGATRVPVSGDPALSGGQHTGP